MTWEWVVIVVAMAVPVLIDAHDPREAGAAWRHHDRRQYDKLEVGEDA